MGSIVYTKGTGVPPLSFEHEWLAHRNKGEWWYCTGFLGNEEGSSFAYQFTLAHIHLGPVDLHMLIASLTNIQTAEHYNVQRPMFTPKGITVNANQLAVGDDVSLVVFPNEHSPMGQMVLHMDCGGFAVDAQMNAVKPPAWHCDSGLLKMGVTDDPEEFTYYYSFTNLATKASVRIGQREYRELEGKTWFDRQGGPYHITRPACAWEWFSLRFNDQTEAMLFSFPHYAFPHIPEYHDGTFIEADGRYRRMNDYALEPIDVITFEGNKFSCGWRLTMEGRKYTIEPMIDGMFNVFFFELLAEVKDEDGTVVGYAFVELMPAVRNKPNVFAAFKRK